MQRERETDRDVFAKSESHNIVLSPKHADRPPRDHIMPEEREEGREESEKVRK